MTIGKISIRPTKHYLIHHADVEWELVISAILSPDKVRQNKRYGKNRYTYIKRFKKFVIEIHAERDYMDDMIWIINAFKMPR